MDTQAFNFSRAAWSLRLVTFFFVDLNMLCQAIHDALPAKLRPGHPAGAIAAMLTSDLAIFPERAGGWYRTVGNHEFLGVHVFLRRYSRWMKSLGASLGFEMGNLLLEDDWLADSPPELQVLICGLMDRVRQDLHAARAINDPAVIAEAFRVVRTSVAAGEHPHQTNARASRITQGLRLVS